LLGTRAHDTAWTEQQLFLQQCGNAPPARPNDFLRHFFFTLLTIFPDPRSYDLASSQPRDRPSSLAVAERAIGPSTVGKTRFGRKENPLQKRPSKSQYAPTNESKR
jgi:hypothetical protein